MGDTALAEPTAAAPVRFARQITNWCRRTTEVVGIYRRWPIAVADRVLLRGQERIYRLSDAAGGATLVARAWADTRIINELWIDDPYLGYLDAAPEEAVTVVDVGANRGYFCVQVGLRYPSASIVAYEPEEENLSLLRTNLARNDLEGRVEVRELALVPDDRRTVQFYEAEFPGYHSTLSPEEFAARGLDASRFTGTVHTLDAANIVAELTGIVERTGGVDLLKIDTEGTEVDLIAALPDDLLASIRCIVAEIEEDPGEELFARLGAAGFESVRTEFHLALTRRGSEGNSRNT
ncbi:MAG: FkbM family methyltransferase [Actinomycetota bacterium]